MNDELKNIARDYAEHYPRITNLVTRKKKGSKIAAVLQEVIGNEIKNSTIVDVGASGCIPLLEIIKLLKPRKAIGIDLDEKNLPPSSAVLTTMVADAMDLPFSDNDIDIIICNHVYEHVSDSEGLFKELYRVLKKGGIIYFGAMNARWPMEPHYDLLFLHWLPDCFSEILVRRKGYDHGYLEKPLSTPKLKQLVKQFDLTDYTVPIIINPEKYNATDVVQSSWVSSIMRTSVGNLLYGFLPSYIWILRKN